MAKAFIFSIDAFVAFTLILVVLHALVFLAAVPSSYYGGLMQATYLARDTLASLSVANASKVVGPAGANMTLLGYVLSHQYDATIIRTYVGKPIPNEYGYRLEYWDTTRPSGTWNVIYDTNTSIPGETHNRNYFKLQATSHLVYFGYLLPGISGGDNAYCYKTCNPSNYGNVNAFCPSLCDAPESRYDDGNATISVVRLTVYR